MIISIDFKRFGVEAIAIDSVGTILSFKSVPQPFAFQDKDSSLDTACQTIEKLKGRQP